MAFHRNDDKSPCAIYVHAGAGFHSYQTEGMHLWVCQQAAMLGMSILKAKGRAIDAVEAAIKFLEDHEITNAGYGSNLSVNGTVECDATVVDHLGRSGAVGAVEHIKNPISLARMVLDTSTKPLSLNRVPPNLLVGSGATDFAYERGMPILHSDFLISPGSRERWLRWKHDLEQAELADKEAASQMDADYQDSMRGPYETATDSPTEAQHGNNLMPNAGSGRTRGTDGSHDMGSFDPPVADTPGAASEAPRSASATNATTPPFDKTLKDAADNIMDTVGAIAVDCRGNIAAGSSSGGIGMKHSGRTGPAALVGIGTAVVPIDPKDDTQTCVAAVSSGTGEHMATTMASSVCAERIYSSTRKVPGQPGTIESVTEDEALKAMIDADFMGHPGVQSSHCHAAIGIMTVKKTKDGIEFYFGHNTDSFAIASMHSKDADPVCVMSRSRGNGKVAQGGRLMQFNRYDP
ncbi:hypothetical protein AJ80_01348 [Polytolypa hystricis UAMH7299]|uniref:Uncharacterized protein n=1 Tax=Polytolypa hystricis (strain UAMH7299) TaxID=1447883 RepID=A0A2B7YSF7_POLH7|nr:hypothetical protein AJ80_01348 [Polytolypa hystricis UAMH7299]